MRRSTLTTLGMAVFGLILVSFVIRGFGQLVVGPRTAMLAAGPVALLAGGLLLVVVVLGLAAWIGPMTFEEEEEEEEEQEDTRR